LFHAHGFKSRGNKETASRGEGAVRPFLILLEVNVEHSVRTRYAQ
jgi:hypothetical protein